MNSHTEFTALVVRGKVFYFEAWPQEDGRGQRERRRFMELIKRQGGTIRTRWDPDAPAEPHTHYRIIPGRLIPSKHKRNPGWMYLTLPRLAAHLLNCSAQAAVFKALFCRVPRRLPRPDGEMRHIIKTNTPVTLRLYRVCVMFAPTSDYTPERRALKWLPTDGIVTRSEPPSPTTEVLQGIEALSQSEADLETAIGGSETLVGGSGTLAGGSETLVGVASAPFGGGERRVGQSGVVISVSVQRTWIL
ncbi:hypothetical protein EHS25_004030 [Saitozyma podzolica]|uniref:BRCT domain-containing protein n=1 Tax=Saitozyma podzolica TaxID=1890683 RepID=A0A427YT21_9TREE|nr:hypothetical protein EHS25_004030 [Saitozyma podzolica]